MVGPTVWTLLLMGLSVGVLTSATSHTPYIIDGHTAKVGAWPWMVSIRNLKTHICGGALIKPSIVLTSANCAYRLTLLNSVVVLGLHNQQDPTIGKPEVIKLHSIIIHENHTLGDDYANLAMLKLKQPSSNNAFIKPITLPKMDYDVVGQVCTFTGWGSSDILDGVALTAELQQKSLEVWPRVMCREEWGLNVNSRRLCASQPDTATPAGLCLRDTGGPLSCPVPGGYVLGGIRLVFTPSCNEGLPAIFTNIPSFIPWINKNSA